MFTGDDDLLNLIQSEAKNLVDSVLEESVTVVKNNSSTFNPSSSAQESDFMQHDEQQLSHQLSYDENSYDHQQQQQQFQLPLINVNNYSINPDQALHSDEISDNFAIKSDCDIIVKSPTIESMSGKSFEDVDDEYNFTSTSGVNVESSLNNNTATNITPSSSPSTQQPHAIAEEAYESSSDNEDIVQDEVQNLFETVLQEPFDVLKDNVPISDVKASTVSFLASEIASTDNSAIVRNINDQKLRRVERKFEHLSSEVREDDPESPDLDQIEGLVSKDDISALQNDFSKISWDESLSATTGDFGEKSSSTPDNDLLQDVINFPGDTYRHQHNK